VNQRSRPGPCPGPGRGRGRGRGCGCASGSPAAERAPLRSHWGWPWEPARARSAPRVRERRGRGIGRWSAGGRPCWPGDRRRRGEQPGEVAGVVASGPRTLRSVAATRPARSAASWPACRGTEEGSPLRGEFGRTPGEPHAECERASPLQNEGRRAPHRTREREPPAKRERASGLQNGRGRALCRTRECRPPADPPWPAGGPGIQRRSNTSSAPAGNGESLLVCLR